MNLPVTSQNTALGVVSLRNSRAITCDIRLDGPFPSIRGLSRKLRRPELISTSLTARNALKTVLHTKS